MSDKEKKNVYIFPILPRSTIVIIKANKSFLNNIDEAFESEFRCFQGNVFVNLDAKYFDLFTIYEIIELDNKNISKE